MNSSWTDVVRHSEGRGQFVLLLGLALAAFLLQPFYNIVDFDVAFLSWTADKLLHHAVFGRDILDVDPPLCVLIYMPAALLAPLLGMEWGIRVWMLVLTVLSLSTLWQTAGRALRLPVAVAVLLFVTLALPEHFAQREEITFLLCAPYVAGRADDRRWAMLSGVMAGVGFMMKPHFLIALAAVFGLRRKIGTEERAIAASGMAYALTLLVFFHPYLREMIPMAMVTYWAISWPWAYVAAQAGFVLMVSVPLALAGAPQPAAVPYFAATLGFMAAAVLQQKGFVYHFIPAYGFMTLFTTARMYNPRRLVALVAAAFLAVEALALARASMAWQSNEASLAPLFASLRSEIDRSSAYTSFVPDPAGGFPMAIHTSSRFVGIAICPIFIQAVARYATGQARGDASMANHLALWQAVTELARQPDLVITWNGPFEFGGRPFDVLSWLNTHDEFRAAWSNYSFDRRIGPFTLYRRR